MTTLWLDGFDTYGNADTLAYTQGPYDVMDFVYSSPTHPRTGTYAALLASGSATYVGKNISAGNTVVIGAAFYPNGVATDRQCGIVLATGYTTANPLLVNATGGNGVKMWRTSTNNIRLVSYVSNVETLIFESTGNEIVSNAFTYVELRLSNTLADATWEIRVNGNVIVGSGALAVAFTWDWFFLAHQPDISNWVDDLYITDDEFLSAQRCYTQFVAADDAPQDWALSSGTDAFELLDDATYNPANYIQGDNVGDISNFSIDAVPVANGIVNAIRMIAVQNLVDAGSGDTLQTAHIGGVDYPGDTHTQSTSELWYSDTIDLAGTGVTLADLAAMTLQVEKTA